MHQRDRDLVMAYIGHLELLGRSPHTITNYRSRIGDLVTYLGPERLATATHDDLTAWRAQLDVADTSVRNYVAAIKGFYSWAHAAGHTSDPAARIPIPPPKRRYPRPIRDEALENAIMRASGHVRLWLVLAGYAGLRCCEIAALQADDVQLHADVPHIIVKGKGGKERVIPLSTYVRLELEAGRLPTRGPAFPRRTGSRPGPVLARTVSAVGNRHLRACGYPETMHQLRHRFGTRTYQVSLDLRAVQDLMGHAHPETTALYAAFSPTAAIAAVDGVQPARHGLRTVADE